MKVLVTCPPMLAMIERFRPMFTACDVGLTAPKIVQTMSVADLVELVPQHDGWIIGDDPANREVLTAGKAGKLKAAVKWGVGMDNVDLAACGELGISIANTPGMFGTEVADVAVGYVIALARETFAVDRAVRDGEWPKPRGVSLSGRTVALIGYGDIGKCAAKRFEALEMKVIAYDPAAARPATRASIEFARWPERIGEADFIVVTCALTPSSRHMINRESLAMAKRGVRIVNVGRGPIIDEDALVAALRSEQVYSAALDVFEIEPLPVDSPLRRYPRCVFGSHNASNTAEAVQRTTCVAVTKLFEFLGLP